MSFAAFGPISFQVVASPTKLEIEKKYHYQAITVIGAPPILQWIYDNLKHVELSIYLHQMWCKPQAAIDGLAQLADFHQPQQFVFGNNSNLGQFVISESRLKHKWLADDGTIIAAELDLKLTEWIDSPQPAGSQPTPTVIGNPPGLTTSQNSAPGSTLVVSPATASPSGIPQQSSFTAVPMTTIARMPSA